MPLVSVTVVSDGYMTVTSRWTLCPLPKLSPLGGSGRGSRVQFSSFPAGRGQRVDPLPAQFDPFLGGGGPSLPDPHTVTP